MTTQRSPRLLEAAIDSMPFSVLVVGNDTRIERGNRAWDRSATARRLTNATVGIGSRYADALKTVVDAEIADSQALERGLDDVLAQRVTIFEHECAVVIDGSRRWFRVVMTSTAGEPGAVIQHHETTASHREQRAHADALAHFKTVFETAIDGIIIFNDELQFLMGNPAVEQLIGRPIEQLHMKRMTDVMHPDDALELQRQQRALLVDGTKRGPLRAYRPDGSVIDMEYVARANFVPGRHMAQLRDMTAARQMESQLRQAQKMQAVGQLTGGIAHDFNNLLTVIIGHADDLLTSDAPLPAPAREGIAEVLRASHRGADMVRKLMAFGRQEQLRLEAVPVDALAADLVLILRRLLPETIDVRCACDEATPSAFVDATAVQQILFNLATNARDAMPDAGGRLEIHVGVAEGPANPLTASPGARVPTQHIQLTVRDSGSGMSAETQARIFDPFFTTKRVGEGTGLGMAMVYGLMEQMSGRIRIESRVGEGTVVFLHFPIATVVEAAVAPSNAGAAQAIAGRESLLLVEDDDAIRSLSARILRRAGYHITEAADGESAEQCLRERAERGDAEFALVVSDIVMPRGGGSRVVTAVRTFAPRTRLLWVTGYPGFGTGDDHAQVPSDDPILRKPWTATELLLRVRESLDQTHNGSALAV